MITAATAIVAVYNRIHIYISSSEASNRRYVKTNNPMYGITLADPDPKHVQQPITNLANVKDELNTLTTSNIYTTVNSGIYVELDEDEIKKA